MSDDVIQSVALSEEKKFVTVANLIARKHLTWSVGEAKIFLMIVQNINVIDEKYCVVLSKKEISSFLGLGNNYDQIRKLTLDMMKSSLLKFGDDEIYDDGYLIPRVKTTKHNVNFFVAPHLLPLIKELKEHYTWFYLENVQGFTSKFSLQLFQYLRSWWTENHIINCQKMYTKDLFNIFGLEMGKDYCRKDGTFSRTNFEKRLCIRLCLKSIKLVQV